MPKDVPEVKSGYQPTLGEEAEGREGRHTGRENEPNLPSLRPERIQKPSYHSNKVLFLSSLLITFLPGKKLGKPRVLHVGTGLIETTCRCGDNVSLHLGVRIKQSLPSP